MLTIIESSLFSKLWPDYWSEDERGDFAAYLATYPEAGDLALLIIYSKSAQENIPAHILRKIVEDMAYG